MNTKKLLITTIVVFVVYSALNFVIHGQILNSSYEELKDTWRPDMMDVMWIMNIGSLVFAFFFSTWLPPRESKTTSISA